MRGHLERRRARPRDRARAQIAGRFGRGASQRICGSVARDLNARRGSGSRRRRSGPRRPRRRARRRQGGIHRRAHCRGSACAFACSSGAGNWTRRAWSRCLTPRRIASCRAARTSGSAAAARCSICRPPRSWRRRSASCSRILQRIGRVRPERVLAPLRGPEWAYRRRARLGVKYVHKKGRVLAGFREREKPYIADLAPLRGIARSRFADAAARARRPGGDAERFARKCRRSRWRPAMSGRRWCFASWRRRAPDGSAKNSRRFGAPRGRADLSAARRPRYGAAAARRLPAARATRVDGGTRRSNSDRSISSRSTATSMSPWWMRPSSCLRPTPGRYGARSVLRPGQFHPAAWRAARGACVGVEGDAALVAKAQANAARNGIGNAAFFAGESVRADAASAPGPSERYDLVLLDPPRAGAPRNAGTHGAVASAAGRVYFLPSGEFGAGCGNLGRMPKGSR